MEIHYFALTFKYIFNCTQISVTRRKNPIIVLVTTINETFLKYYKDHLNS